MMMEWEIDENDSDDEDNDGDLMMMIILACMVAVVRVLHMLNEWKR